MKVVVIGGGASGVMSAIFASDGVNEVTLIEKNEKIGKKLYITGKGRCNVTNDTFEEDFFNNVVSNPRFLMSSVNAFPPSDVKEFFSSCGLKLKTERGNRVFPVSDKSSDVIKTLLKRLEFCCVDLRLSERVEKIVVENVKAVGVKTDKNFYPADAVIVATGGVSYPLTGSTGDGYVFARSTGHSVVTPVPALSAFLTKGGFPDLAGLALKNVNLKIYSDSKLVSEEFGEMLFTHDGVSGSIVLTSSSRINRDKPENLSVFIDLKPALSEECLDDRVLRDFAKYSGKQLKNALFDLLPSSIIPRVISLAGLDGEKKISVVTAKERLMLVKTLKNFKIDFISLAPLKEAIVTSGGVNVKEVNPKTMESKIVKGLYFVGEVLDVDAYTGGFNLQIAFSTGAAAGRAVAEKK